MGFGHVSVTGSTSDFGSSDRGSGSLDRESSFEPGPNLGRSGWRDYRPGCEVGSGSYRVHNDGPVSQPQPFPNYNLTEDKIRSRASASKEEKLSTSTSSLRAQTLRNNNLAPAITLQTHQRACRNTAMILSRIPCSPVAAAPLRVPSKPYQGCDSSPLSQRGSPSSGRRRTSIAASSRHDSSPSNQAEQGWISITKPKQIQLLQRRGVADVEVVAEKGRVTIGVSSPEVANRTGKSGASVHGDESIEQCLERGSSGSFNYSWLSEKIKQCGEVLGVTVCDCVGGWNSVIHFAQERER